MRFCFPCCEYRGSFPQTAHLNRNSCAITQSGSHAYTSQEIHLLFISNERMGQNAICVIIWDFHTQWWGKTKKHHCHVITLYNCGAQKSIHNAQHIKLWGAWATKKPGNQVFPNLPPSCICLCMIWLILKRPRVPDEADNECMLSISLAKLFLSILYLPSPSIRCHIILIII